MKDLNKCNIDDWVETDSNNLKLWKEVSEAVSWFQKEFLVIINSEWNLTWEVVERKKAHIEWIPHYSVHTWVVNTTKFKDDIWIYVSNKAVKDWKSYIQPRWSGWHVSVSKDWKIEWEEQIARWQLLKDASIREVDEELWLRISEDWKIYDSKTWELLQNYSNFRTIIDKVPYQSVKTKSKAWKLSTELNNEHIWVYAFEYNGEITNFEEREIDSITLIASKELLDKMENDYELFWEKSLEKWKQSNKYIVAKRVLLELQEYYNIK